MATSASATPDRYIILGSFSSAFEEVVHFSERVGDFVSVFCCSAPQRGLRALLHAPARDELTCLSCLEKAGLLLQSLCFWEFLVSDQEYSSEEDTLLVTPKQPEWQ